MKRYKLNRARFAEFLLEVGTMAGTAALLDEKRIRDSGAFTDLMVQSRMETIVRDCIVSERLGESWSKYLEGLIQGLATFFEEVQDGTL